MFYRRQMCVCFEIHISQFPVLFHLIVCYLAQLDPQPCEVSPSLPLWVSPQSKACTSRPGVTFLECLIGTATSREDDGLHTTRVHRRPGPGCSSGPHGGERAVRAGGLPAAATQHRESGRGFQDGPGDEDNRQHR